MTDRRPLLAVLAIVLFIVVAVVALRPRDTPAPQDRPTPPPAPEVSKTPPPVPPPVPARTAHEPHATASPAVAVAPMTAPQPAPAPDPHLVIRAPGPKTVLISSVAGEPPDLIPDPAGTPDEAPEAPPAQGWNVWGSDNGVAGTLAADHTVSSAAGEGTPSLVVGCAGRRPYMLFDPGVGLDTTAAGSQEYLQVVISPSSGDLQDVKLTVKRNSGTASFPTPKQWLTRIEAFEAFEISYLAPDQTPVVARFTNRGAEALATELGACR